MPRYAANLSFDPIQPQPLLPTPVNVTQASTSASKSNESNNTLASITSKQQGQSNKEEITTMTGTQVPAAQFDWSSAGLVNPLDGEWKSKIFCHTFFASIRLVQCLF